MRAKLRHNPVPVKYHAYGAVPGRRREEAIAVAHNTKLRCLRSRKSHAQFFRDAAGAFNSVRHEAIAENLSAHQSGPDKQFFDVTHRNAHLDMGGGKCWRITKGTLPGHTIGGDIFLGAYGQAIDEYLQHKDCAWESIQYDEQFIDMSITSFVDDIGEFTMAANVEELHQKSVHNTMALEHALDKVGCALEPSKEVVIPRMMGSGAHAQTTNCHQHARGSDYPGQEAEVRTVSWSMARGQRRMPERHHEAHSSHEDRVFRFLWSVERHASTILVEEAVLYCNSVVRRDLRT